MKTIKIKCTNNKCNAEHEVPRTNEIPEECVSMKCNWCPKCESEKSGDYYEEEYLDENGELLNQAK